MVRSMIPQQAGLKFSSLPARLFPQPIFALEPVNGTVKEI
jgi:hypothetical protein